MRSRPELDHGAPLSRIRAASPSISTNTARQSGECPDWPFASMTNPFGVAIAPTTHCTWMTSGSSTHAIVRVPSSLARTLFELAGGEVGPRRHIVADLDGDGAPEVVLLAVGQDGATRMLDLVVVPSSERGLVRTEEARPLPDAPLTLTIALPDPNAP